MRYKYTWSVIKDETCWHTESVLIVQGVTLHHFKKWRLCMYIYEEVQRKIKRKILIKI